MSKLLLTAALVATANGVRIDDETDYDQPALMQSSGADYSSDYAADQAVADTAGDAGLNNGDDSLSGDADADADYSQDDAVDAGGLLQGEQPNEVELERQKQLQRIRKSTNMRLQKMQDRHEIDLGDVKTATREAVEADETIAKDAMNKISDIKRSNVRLEGDARAARKADTAQFQDMKQEARARAQKARMDMQNEDRYDSAKDQVESEVQDAADNAAKKKGYAERDIMRLTMKHKSLKEENDLIREKAEEDVKRAEAKNYRELKKSGEELATAEFAAREDRNLATRKLADVDKEMEITQYFGEKDAIKNKKRARDTEDAAMEKEKIIKSENAEKVRGTVIDSQDEVKKELEDASDSVYEASNDAARDVDRAIKRRAAVERRTAELRADAEEERERSMKDNENSIVTTRKEADLEARRSADAIRSAAEQANKMAKRANAAQAYAENTQALTDTQVMDAKGELKQASALRAENEEGAVDAEKGAEQAELEASDRIQKANKDANTRIEAMSERLDTKKEQEDEAAAGASEATSEGQTQIQEARRQAGEQVAEAKEKNAATLAEVREKIQNKLKEVGEEEHETMRKIAQRVETASSTASANVLAAKEKAANFQKSKQMEAIQETKAADRAESLLDRTKRETAEEIATIKENADKEIVQAQSEADVESQKARAMEKKARAVRNKATKDLECTNTELQQKAEAAARKLNAAKVDAETEEKKQEELSMSAEQAESAKRAAEREAEQAKRDLDKEEEDAAQKRLAAKCKNAKEEAATEKEEKDEEEKIERERKQDMEDAIRMKQANDRRIRNAKFALSKQETKLREEEAQERQAAHEADLALKERREEDRQKAEALQKVAREQAAADRHKARELKYQLKLEEQKIVAENTAAVKQAKLDYYHQLQRTKMALKKEEQRTERAEDAADEAKKITDQKVADVKNQVRKQILEMKDNAKDKEQMSMAKHAEDVSAEEQKLQRLQDADAKEYRDAEKFHQDEMTRVHREIEQTASRREKMEREMAVVKRKETEALAQAHEHTKMAIQEATEKHQAEKKAQEAAARIADTGEEKVDKEFETAKLNAVATARDMMAPDEDDDN